MTKTSSFGTCLSIPTIESAAAMLTIPTATTGSNRSRTTSARATLRALNPGTGPFSGRDDGVRGQDHSRTSIFPLRALGQTQQIPLPVGGARQLASVSDDKRLRDH